MLRIVRIRNARPFRAFVTISACLAVVLNPHFSLAPDPTAPTLARPAWVAAHLDDAQREAMIPLADSSHRGTQTAAQRATEQPDLQQTAVARTIAKPAPAATAVQILAAANPASSGDSLPSAMPCEPTPPRADGTDAAHPFDDRRTSWESPFTVLCWNTKGWDFDGHAMRSSSGSAVATFRRPYQRLMLDCRIEPLSEGVGPIMLRLIARETNASLAVAINGDVVSIVADNGSGESRVVRETRVHPAAAQGAAVHLRLAAPGNRLLVSWNERIIVACELPAGLRGRAASFAFISQSSPFEIRGLRVEGE